MKNFEIGADYRLKMKLGTGEEKLDTTPTGVKFIPYDVMGPGLANVYRLAALYCVGDGLDIGSSYFQNKKHNGFPGSTPVDITIPGSGCAEKLIQENESQDYVFASHIYEHVTDPEKCIQEAYRVLVLGGVLFTYSPFPGHHQWDPKISPQFNAGPDGHRWQPSPTSMCRLLQLCGFTIKYAEWEPDHIHSFVVVGRK